MAEKIIGRTHETALLNSYANSQKAEFVAIYGRRRVGKTFLVNHAFQDRLTFSMTGVLDGDRNAQMHAFTDALDQYEAPVSQKPADWYEAFQQLRHFLMQRTTDSQPCIVFIDELPCFDTRKSDFVKALGYFWNSWASLQSNMLLIVCGSATSWMMENVIDSHGGLHDRITHEIHLKEFTLNEVEQYLLHADFPWDRLQTLQVYMMMGGIPYYLSLLNKDESLAQNADRLFFRPNSEMRREFQRLYKTLFASPDPYIALVETLYKKKKGLTRDEIAKAIGKDANGRLTKMLRNLIDCDIVRFYHTKQKKISARNGLYQLMDFYSIFYLQFIKDGSTDEQFWTKSLNTPTQNTWRGLAFERICLAHIPQIKQALKIDGVKTEYYSWRSSTQTDDAEKKQNAQIDLVIERADRMVNLCEAKYSEGLYTLNKDEYLKQQYRNELFRQQTAFGGGIVPTLITTFGLQRNSYSEHIPAQLTMDDLFQA